MQMQEGLGEWAVAEVLYESSLKHYGVPVELRLFDPQFSENLNEEWLAQAAERYGITPAEIQAWVADGLLKKWPGPDGATNFTLYSEKQAQVIKGLFSNPRYSKEEVSHIAGEWNSYLEMVREEPQDLLGFGLLFGESLQKRLDQLIYQLLRCREPQAFTLRVLGFDLCLQLRIARAHQGPRR